MAAEDVEPSLQLRFVSQQFAQYLLPFKITLHVLGNSDKCIRLGHGGKKAGATGERVGIVEPVLLYEGHPDNFLHPYSRGELVGRHTGDTLFSNRGASQFLIDRFDECFEGNHR